MKKRKRKIKFRFKLLLLAFFLIYVGVAIYVQQMNIYELEEKKEELTLEYEQTQDELDRLEHKSEYMNTNDYIENTAREKLGLAYEDELVIEPSKKESE